jgi:excisionase family DNA binding protein
MSSVECEPEGADVTEPGDWISVREAARLMGVPSRTLYNRIKAGTWPVRVVEFGYRNLRVSRSEFEGWLHSKGITLEQRLLDLDERVSRLEAERPSVEQPPELSDELLGMHDDDE